MTITKSVCWVFVIGVLALVNDANGAGQCALGTQISCIAPGGQPGTKQCVDTGTGGLWSQCMPNMSGTLPPPPQPVPGGYDLIPYDQSDPFTPSPNPLMDDNGLLLNPKWRFQAAYPNAVPNGSDDVVQY
jgi:hypothetical protein